MRIFLAGASGVGQRLIPRLGQFYGPGTYNEQQPPEEPRVHIDRAAERTVEALGQPTGAVVIVD